MRGVGGIEGKQREKTIKPRNKFANKCASSELIFKIKKKNPVATVIPKLLGNIQEAEGLIPEVPSSF